MTNDLSGKKCVSISMAIGFILTFALFLSCSPNAHADELSGTTWVLTYDPDSPNAPPDDMMVFKNGNEVDLRDSNSVYLTCAYEILDPKVVLRCTVRGRTKRMELNYSADRNILENPSGAEYTRQ